MTSVVVLGANGQLGTELVRVLRAAGGYDARSLTHDQIEVTDPESVRAALEGGGRMSWSTARRSTGWMTAKTGPTRHCA